MAALLAVFEAVVSTYAFVDASVSFDGAGTVTVPVNVGEAIGALSPRFVAVVVAKFSSSPSAAASSLRVFSASGAVSTRLETAVLTKAVVATAVELSPAVWVTAIVPVGSVGVPVSVGESSGALRSRAVWVAVDTGLFTSLVLSTLPSPTSPLTKPVGAVIEAPVGMVTVPVNVGEASGAFVSI